MPPIMLNRKESEAERPGFYRLIWMEDELESKGVELELKHLLANMVVNGADCQLVLARNLEVLTANLELHGQFHAAILDMKILSNTMAGLEACKIIQSHTKHRKTPIVIMTWNASPETQELAYQEKHGAIVYYIKSSNLASLNRFSAIIRNILKNQDPITRYHSQLGFEIDKRAGTIHFQGKLIENLTPVDRALLSSIVENGGSLTNSALVEMFRITANNLDRRVFNVNAKFRLGNFDLAIVARNGRRVIFHKDSPLGIEI